MIEQDQIRGIKTSLKTLMGQLNYVLKNLSDEQQCENNLLQLKAAQSTLNKIIFELLDDAYRKAMAEKLSAAHQLCPGNCGNELEIERLLRLFPHISLEEIPEKLKEAYHIEEELMKFLLEKNLTPPPLED